MKETFYKLARPDGFDFYTGETINYRENIGKDVRPPKKGKACLCSDTCLHASKNPNDAFIGASIPCSVFRVEGTPRVKDQTKAGFRQLRVVEELDPEKVFEWRYAEAINPFNPFSVSPPKIIDKHILLLKKWGSVWDSVRGSVWDSIGDSVWASVRGSVWASIGDSVGDSVRDSVWGSVWASVRGSIWDSIGDSVWASVRGSVWDSIGDSVGDSVRDSVRDSVWDSVWGYIGHIFQPSVPKWRKEYPYQSAIDLWRVGLVPSYDGKVWRLHGGKNVEILWEGTIEEIKD